MESKAELFGHPIHPMLIPFLVGLLSASVVLTTGRTSTPQTRFPGGRQAIGPGLPSEGVRR